MKKTLLRRAAALLLTLSLLLSLAVLPAGAADGSTTAGYTIEISIPAAEVEVGGKIQFTAVVKDAGGNTVLTEESQSGNSPAITWTSSDRSIAWQTSYGRVWGQAEGTAAITATYTYEENGEKKTVTSNSVEVTVTKKPVPAESIAFIGGPVDKFYVEPDETKKAPSVSVTPADTTDELVWESEDPGVATVDENGNVTGVSAGKVNITATVGAYTLTQPVEVSGIAFEDPTPSVYVGHTATLALEKYGDARAITDVKLTTGNIAIAEFTDSNKLVTYNVGDTRITAQVDKYTASGTLSVIENAADRIDCTMNAGEVLSFSDLLSDLNTVCQRKNGGASLVSVNALLAPTNAGALFHGYVSPEAQGTGVGNESYYVNQTSGRNRLADITFVPAAGFSGAADITYNGRSSNDDTFSGVIRITVEGLEDVVYSTAANTPVSFETADFSEVCRTITGKEIQYMTFEQPSARQGALYYKYRPNGYSTLVDESKSYYRTKSPEIADITFVPAEGFTGTVRVPYRCVTSGDSFSGTMTIYVQSTGSGSLTVEYSIGAGGTANLDASEFNDVCQAVNGTNLSYVTFTLPATDEGVLYYNYVSASNRGSKVTAGGRYFRSSGTPRLNSVSFVAAEGFTGKVVIPFTGYDTLLDTFNGELIIWVDNSDGTVYYTTGYGQPVDFETVDLNELCVRGNGESMEYVTFTLPDSDEGTLYYNYSGASSRGTRLTASTKVWRTSGVTVSDVTFVPASGFSGIVEIPFSGEDADGASFDGQVRVEVSSSYGGETVAYSVVRGSYVEFAASDFNAACRAITGDSLEYVSFKLPDSRYGKLYYNYDPDSGRNTAVSASYNYHRADSNRLLNNVAFAADGGSTGAVTISYTGRTADGESFNGEVRITVTAAQSEEIRYAGSSLPVAFSASDFVQACQSITGRALSYIKFSALPPASTGRLYVGYNGPHSPGQQVTAGTAYYADDIGRISFVAAAGAEGQISLAYTGVDAAGREYEGTVHITLSNIYCTSPFADISGYPWAKPSVEFLRTYGIVTGYSATQYGPARAITRGEFATMVYRAFRLSDSGASSFPDVLAGHPHARAIAAAKAAGVVQGINGYFYPDRSITRQDAVLMICRAMEAKGWSVPAVAQSGLNAYADGGQVASYARSAMASLVYLGVVRGDDYMRLKPTAAISRVEMAVLLHRVLTL